MLGKKIEIQCKRLRTVKLRYFYSLKLNLLVGGVKYTSIQKTFGISGKLKS